ncbi:MAG: hypothetical protein M1837_006004 [Sclerophora amabilis]|nr:MAG: hypothetical protein M1837_006004 [Sclerophora amabilis]
MEKTFFERSDETQLQEQHQTHLTGLDSPAPIDSAAERRLLRKCDLRVVPILFVLYVVSFLDRINIGNARIEGLEEELQMAGSDYNVALQIFFVPYILLEVPSNIILKRIAPSTWLSSIMFLWGIATVCQGLTRSFAGLVVCRALLGVFEAGFLPGSIYLISMYYKRHELQKRFTAFFCSGLVAGAFGGLFAYALAKMDGIGGYAGWRWIFIIEGLLTIVLAVISKFLIVDWPETARFLNAEEKALLSLRLEQDGGFARMDRLDRKAKMRILRDWKIYVGTVIYIGVCTSGYATAFFIPTILNEFGYSSSQAQLHSIPIYVAAAGVMLFAAWATDRLRHRYSFTIGGVLLSTIGYVVLLAQGGVAVGVKYMAVFFVVTGVYVTQPIAMVWLANNMGGHYKRSVGSAVQIGFGNIGGIIGSNIFITTQKPRYPVGYGTGLGMLWLCALMCTVFFFGMRAENRKREAGKRADRWQLTKVELENLGDEHPKFRYVL